MRLNLVFTREYLHCVDLFCWNWFVPDKFRERERLERERERRGMGRRRGGDEEWRTGAKIKERRGMKDMDGD